MVVPDSLLLSFFKNASSTLKDDKSMIRTFIINRNNDDPISRDPSSSVAENSGGVGSGVSGLSTLEICRRQVLDVQREVLQRVIAESKFPSPVRVQERLQTLSSERNLSHQLIQAMDEMTECARIALCTLVLYGESSSSSSSRPVALQNGGRLDRTKLVEYFGLCQTSLNVPRVLRFISRGTPLFEDMKSAANNGESNEAAIDVGPNDSDTLWQHATMHYPQTRLEFTQRLLSQAIGWDPDYLTEKLRIIFVEKQKPPLPSTQSVSGHDNENSNNDDDNEQYNASLATDTELQQLFEQTVSFMQRVILEVGSSQAALLGRDGENHVGDSVAKSIKDLNDYEQGGVTRVLNVQYSEIEITPDGRRINVVNGPPSAIRNTSMDDNNNDNTVNPGKSLSDEEQKRQIRMASDAAVLQQEILGQLFSLDEHERNNLLDEAKEASRTFQDGLMALPPGSQRIDYLRSIPVEMSRKIAMYKCWENMKQQNGGRSPKMAPKCPHHNS